MSANELLLWMSFRKEGTWSQFRGAIAMCGASDSEDEEAQSGEVSAQQLLRMNLQRLGHAEFFAGRQTLRWRIAPPVLALSRANHGWVGMAAGARHPSLVQRLTSSPLLSRILPLRSAPDALLFHSATADQLEDLARAASMNVQHEAPAAILGCIPPIDAKHLLARRDMPLGRNWRIDRFDPGRLSWVTSNRHEASGPSEYLYKFESDYQKHFLLCGGGAQYLTPLQLGKFVSLKRHRRKVLRYDSGAARLSLPSICRPPLLVERALVLCSGRLPTYERLEGRGVLHYDDIPLSIAISAASLLRQELRP